MRHSIAIHLAAATLGIAAPAAADQLRPLATHCAAQLTNAGILTDAGGLAPDHPIHAAFVTISTHGAHTRPMIDEAGTVHIAGPTTTIIQTGPTPVQTAPKGRQCPFFVAAGILYFPHGIALPTGS